MSHAFILQEYMTIGRQVSKTGEPEVRAEYHSTMKSKKIGIDKITRINRIQLYQTIPLSIHVWMCL